MACPNPATDGQLTSGDPEGAASCVAYSFSYSVCTVTNGKRHPSGNSIRDWTGDHYGGLELAQCDVAVARNVGVNYDTRVYTKAQFYTKLAAGYDAVLIGNYNPIKNSKFSGQPYFSGNHGWNVPKDHKVKDPLCDGRRAGIYKYHGEVYPVYLIDAFAASLVMSNGNRAGKDHFEASFAKVQVSPPAPAVRYEITFDGGAIGYYRVSGRTIQGVTTMTGRNPFTARCTAPARYLWPGHASKSLVRIISGFAKGRYVNVGNDKIHLKEI